MVVSPVAKGLIGVGLAGTGIVGTSLILTKSNQKYGNPEEKCKFYKTEGHLGIYQECLKQFAIANSQS